MHRRCLKDDDILTKCAVYSRVTMGQTQFHGVPGQVAMLTDRLRLHAVGMKQLTTLSYEQFLESVSLLNGM